VIESAFRSWHSDAVPRSSCPQVHAVPTSLLQTTTRLDHLLTLLAQPRHLDSISRRVKVLVSDLERIHDSRRKLGDTRPLNVALSGGMTLSTLSPEGGAASSTPSLAGAAAASSAARGDGSTTSLPPDALQKIDALFTLLPRIDPLVPLAPRLVARLRSLANLHASAAKFGESLAELKGQVAELGEGEQGLREVVHGLEKNFEENEERVKGNLEAMDRRVDDVLKRLDRLAA
jgi:nuclear migration protein JNM1